MPKPSAGAAAANKGANTFGNIVSGLGTVASASGSATGAVAALGGQIGKVAGMFGPWGQAIGKVIETAAKLPSVFKAAADGIATYVQAFSPATAGRYQRAWADLNASIGQMLMPVLNAATAVVRYFGDTIAGLTPIVEPLIRGAISLVAPYFKEIGNVLREFISTGVIMAQAWLPLLDAFGLTKMYIDFMVGALKQLATVMKQVNQTIAGVLGLKVPGFEGASVGKAFVSTQQQSVSGMLDSIRQRAYQLGGPAGKEDKQQQQVDILGKILAALENFKPEKIAALIVKGMSVVMASLPATFAEALGGLLEEALKNLPKDVGKAIKDGLDKLPATVAKAIADALPKIPKFPNF